MSWRNELPLTNAREVREGAGAARSSDQHAQRSDEASGGGGRPDDEADDAEMGADVTWLAAIWPAARKAAAIEACRRGEPTQGTNNSDKTRRRGHQLAADRRVRCSCCPSGIVRLDPNDCRQAGSPERTVPGFSLHSLDIAVEPKKS